MPRVRSAEARAFAAGAILVALLAAASASAEVGGQAGAYLRPPVGASALGSGGAYTAAPSHGAPWWNPATLAFLRERRLAAGTGLRSLGRMDAYGSFEFPVPPRVGMGLFALYRGDPFLDDLHIGTWEDDIGATLPSAAYTTLTAKVAASYYISRRVSAGIALSFHHQSLPTYGTGGGIRYVSADGVGALDAALSFRANAGLTLAAVVRNLGASMEWQMGDFEPIVADEPLPSFTLGGLYETTLHDKPLRCMADLTAYLFDGEWQRLDHDEAVLCLGAEWQGWESFYLRAGLGDISLTGDLVRNTSDYFDDYTMRVTAGFSRHLREVRDGLWLNYGVGTDKVWAGVNQQVDVTFSF